MATKTELAEMLALTTRQIDRLTSDGLLKADPDGRYDPRVCVAAYCRHIRLDEPSREARREQLRAQTVDTKLKTRRQLAGLLTREEARGAVTKMWLINLEVWRSVARHAFYALRAQVGDSEARVIAATFESSVVAWLAEARDEAMEQFETVLGTLDDPARVDALLQELEKTCDAVFEEMGAKEPTEDTLPEQIRAAARVVLRPPPKPKRKKA